MSAANQLKQWVKQGETPTARVARQSFYAVRYLAIPVIPGVHALLYQAHTRAVALLHWLVQTLYYSPLFRARCESCGGRLHLYTGMPYIAGPLRIRVGSNCRISGKTTFNGRGVSQPAPLLQIGDNCDIGWQNSLTVGTEIRIGNNVRLAGNVSLLGYPGHPMDAADRAAGLPDLDSQARAIVLEDDVWVGTGATITAGVTVGAGSVIATGSVVTKSIPPMVLAGGNPARVIRSLNA